MPVQIGPDLFKIACLYEGKYKWLYGENGHVNSNQLVSGTDLYQKKALLNIFICVLLSSFSFPIQYFLHFLSKPEFDHDNDLDNNVKGEEVTFEELHHKKPSRRNGRRR